MISTPTPAISLTKTLISPSNGIANVGEVVRYRLVISNTGTTNVTQLTLTDTFDPAILQYDSASIAPNSTASGSLIWNSNIVPIASGTSKTINVYFKALNAASSTNNAATTTNGQDQNNTVIPDKTANRPVIVTRPGLSVNKVRTSSSTASIGSPVTYTVTLTNTGTTNITTLPLEDVYSDFCLTFVSASTPPNSVGGGTLNWTNLAATPLAPGGEIIITLNFTAKNQCTPASNTASVGFATDENGDPIPPVQSSATVTINESPRIGVAKNLTSIVNNLNGTYTVTLLLTVENFGDVGLDSLTLFDNIPTQFAGATPITSYAATSGTLLANAGWNGTATSNILAIGQSLAVGASGTVSISFVITPPGLTSYNNNATATGISPIDAVVSDISTDGLDPDGTNNDNNPNESVPTPVPVPGADLSISKTDGSATYTPGNAITYTIVVGNNGPSNVTGATVGDLIPAAITGATWSSTTQGTATVSGGASGSGNTLSATVNLPAGAGNTVTFTVTGTVSPSASGNLVNTATVTPPAGVLDPTPGNDSATDTDTYNSAIVASYDNLGTVASGGTPGQAVVRQRHLERRGQLRSDLDQHHRNGRAQQGHGQHQPDDGPGDLHAQRGRFGRRQPDLPDLRQAQPDGLRHGPGGGQHRSQDRRGARRGSTGAFGRQRDASADRQRHAERGGQLQPDTGQHQHARSCRQGHGGHQPDHGCGDLHADAGLLGSGQPAVQDLRQAQPDGLRLSLGGLHHHAGDRGQLRQPGHGGLGRHAWSSRCSSTTP